jgi:hypothetical protein
MYWDPTGHYGDVIIDNNTNPYPDLNNNTGIFINGDYNLNLDVNTPGIVVQTGGANVTITITGSGSAGLINTSEGSNVTVNNNGSVNTVSTGAKSTTDINNKTYGTINSINFGSNSTNSIQNYGIIGTVSNAARTHTEISNYGYIASAIRGAGLSGLFVNGKVYRTYNGSLEALSSVKWNRVNDFLSFLDAEWVSMQYSAAEWYSFINLYNLKGKSAEQIFQLMDDYGNATMAGDPIPSGCGGILSYSDNLAAGFAMFVGKGGKTVVKNLDELAASAGKLEKFDFNKYLRELIGDPPSGMFDPHAHHILFKEGLGKAQKELVKEGQELLKRYGIEPILGKENLTWAPMRVAGQHGIDVLKDVVNTLKKVEKAGGDYDDIVQALKELGEKAASRR